MKKTEPEQDWEGITRYLESPTLWYQWCCDCGLRHIFYYRIEDKKIAVTMFRDSYATYLERKVKRLKKMTQTTIKLKNNK